MLLYYSLLYHVIFFALAAYAYHKRDEKVWCIAAMLGFTLFLNGNIVMTVDSFNNVTYIPIDTAHIITLMASLICTLFFMVDLIDNNKTLGGIASFIPFIKGRITRRSSCKH